MKNYCITILSIFVILNSIANAQNGKEMIYGKWKECTKVSYDTVISLDSNFTCQGEWLYDFKKDGNYLENFFVECEGKRYQEGGTWKWEEGKITIHDGILYCSNGYAYPETMKMIWLNKDKWVFVGRESEKVLVYIYYERVP